MPEVNKAAAYCQIPEHINQTEYENDAQTVLNVTQLKFLFASGLTGHGSSF